MARAAAPCRPRARLATADSAPAVTARATDPSGTQPAALFERSHADQPDGRPTAADNLIAGDIGPNDGGSVNDVADARRPGDPEVSTGFVPSLYGVTPYGPQLYEDLAGRLYGLLIGLKGRMSYDAWIIYEFIERRYYGLALEKSPGP